MEINYDIATADHIPFSMVLNVGTLPMIVSHDDSMVTGRVNWANVSKDDVYKYLCHTDQLLGNIVLPKDAILCRDINCKNVEHSKLLCSLYDCIVESINVSSKSLIKKKLKAGYLKPGWNDHVEGLHAEARKAFKLWVESGKVKHGPLFEHKKNANAQFKYALRYIKRHENMRYIV